MDSERDCGAEEWRVLRQIRQCWDRGWEGCHVFVLGKKYGGVRKNGVQLMAKGEMRTRKKLTPYPNCPNCPFPHAETTVLSSRSTTNKEVLPPAAILVHSASEGLGGRVVARRYSVSSTAAGAEGEVQIPCTSTGVKECGRVIGLDAFLGGGMPSC